MFYSGTSTAKSHQRSMTAVEMGKRGELLDKDVGLFPAGGQQKALKFLFYLCSLEPFENKTRSIIELAEEQHEQ